MKKYLFSALGILVLFLKGNSQRYDLRLNLLAEQYYGQIFDLWSPENNSTSYFTLRPSPRIGLGLGIKVGASSSIAIGYSFGSVSSVADLYTDQIDKIGRLILTELSSQLSVSYQYHVNIRDNFRFCPTVDFVINRSMFDYRRQSL